MKRCDKLAGFYLLIFVCLFNQLQAQPDLTSSENYAEAGCCRKTGQNGSILFWNVENLFDYRDDTLTSDEEFTGSGTMHWSYSKLQIKLAHVAKTILAAGEWNPPAIIGMCEVENHYVLTRLMYASPLRRFGYRLIHRDSPDSRGIDVAFLYRPNLFIPVSAEWITIRFPFDTTATTREILYVKGVLFGTDTLHLFVNHWPSRRGGEVASAPRRNFVASVLREKVDSLIQLSDTGLYPAPGSILQREGSIADHTSRITYPCILIMGDFNDEPENESLAEILQARLDSTGMKPSELINLSYLVAGKQGSHKFREHWGLLDQFIVSGALLNRQHPLQVTPDSLRIFKPGFLLEDDLKYLDKKPKRTYVGPRYKGGFSDHLPIIVEIKGN